jgi:hypothetical protein
MESKSPKCQRCQEHQEHIDTLELVLLITAIKAPIIGMLVGLFAAKALLPRAN